MFNPGLKPRQVISNEELRSIFVCANMGGMRRSKTTNTLVIISDHTQGLYEDKWIEDTLHYTGMGKKGDQDINSSQNKTLKESNMNGVDVFLFEVFKERQYTYRGQVKLSKTPYQSKQIDEDGITRNVWIFPVKIVDNDNLFIPKDIIDDNFKDKEEKIKKLSYEKLREKAIEGQSTKTSARITTNITYERNVYVSEFAKKRANGICQLCSSEAPFKNKLGEPYLETHHIEWLSRGGSDTIENTVALCPNCHRKMHVVDSDDDIESLKEKIRTCILS